MTDRSAERHVGAVSCERMSDTANMEESRGAQARFCRQVKKTVRFFLTVKGPNDFHRSARWPQQDTELRMRCRAATNIAIWNRGSERPRHLHRPVHQYPRTSPRRSFTSAGTCRHYHGPSSGQASGFAITLLPMDEPTSSVEDTSDPFMMMPRPGCTRIPKDPVSLVSQVWTVWNSLTHILTARAIALPRRGRTGTPSRLATACLDSAPQAS